jgi:hypothetical protein
LQFEGSTDTNSQYELEKIHGDIDKSSCGFSNSSGDIDRLSLLYFSDPELLFGRSETRYVHLFSSYFPTCSLFCLSIGIEFEAVQPVAKRKPKMLGFGYMLLVMLIVATISIAENSRTHEGLLPSSTRLRVPVGQEALDLIPYS